MRSRLHRHQKRIIFNVIYGRKQNENGEWIEIPQVQNHFKTYFSFALMFRTSKLERLAFGSFFKSCFSQTLAYPSQPNKHKCFNQANPFGLGQFLPKTRRLPIEWKHYQVPWGQCFGTFYVRNIQMFLISYSICPWQAFPAWLNEARSLPKWRPKRSSTLRLFGLPANTRIVWRSLRGKTLQL